MKDVVRDPKKMVIGLSIAGLGIIAKHSNLINFGFYGNGTGTTVSDVNKKNN
jgi:hypothetical protein